VPFYVYKGLGFFDADEIKDVLALLAYLADPVSPLRAAALLRSRVVRVTDETLKRLAPDLPGALSEAGPPLPSDLDAGDAGRLRTARRSLATWQPWVDRLPPAELLDRVLAESAYARELAGPGFAQARENLKKIRGLVRRIQNRGYATLERLVEHFAQLVAGGDESNAIIDAVDAVNLMTVHAAKGLEFPIVFIVSIGRGSGGGRDPIRVAPGPADEGDGVAPTVGIGDHETEADADAEAREAEESKRLLYVSLTRARDRLYLAGVVDPAGRIGTAKGSLGRHLPASLLEAMGQSWGPPHVMWTGPAVTHVLGSVPPADEQAPVRWNAAPVPAERSVEDFAALLPDGTARTSVSGGGLVTGTVPVTRERRSSAALGTLVHALVAHGHRRGLLDEAGLGLLADHLMRADDGAALPPAGRARAVAAAAGLLARDELRARAGATVLFETPYSRRLDDGRIERGTIDCLVVEAASVLVLELKTGAALEPHGAQLDAYVQAARALYPGRRVEGRLVYTPER
jgi:ATP-dependent exoDNAse (exonuclease V) beta subunit